MKPPNIIHKQVGFTLIEALLYTAIFAIVAGLATNIFYIILKSDVQNNAEAEVRNNIRYIEQVITQQIESAVKIDTINSSSLSLITASSTLNPTVFNYSNNNLYFQQGQGSNFMLNTDKVEITDFSFQLSPPQQVDIDAYYHNAYNPNVGYFDFANSYGKVRVPVGAGDLSGLAYNRRIGWISLNCASNDQCDENSYKVSSDASGVLSGSALALGDGLYLDNDDNNLVSSGDIRLAIGSNNATGLGKTVGSTVAAGDNDINTSLGLVLPASLIKSTGTDGDFVSGTEGLYLDYDNSNTVSIGDRRLVIGNTAAKGAGYIVGSLVASGNSDIGTTLLPVSAAAKIKSTDTSGNFMYSEGFINFSGVTINQTTGFFDGKATASNIGYISFNCATGGASGENICSSYNYKVKDTRDRTSSIKVNMVIKYKSTRPNLAVIQSANFSVNLKKPSSVTINSITPNLGQNTGTVNITSITGTNFQNGAIVKLVKAGQIDVYPSTNFTFTSSSQLSGGAFDLTGVQKGTWDVYVINPDGQIGVLGSGFTVN